MDEDLMLDFDADELFGTMSDYLEGAEEELFGLEPLTTPPLHPFNVLVEAPPEWAASAEIPFRPDETDSSELDWSLRIAAEMAERDYGQGSSSGSDSRLQEGPSTSSSKMTSGDSDSPSTSTSKMTTSSGDSDSPADTSTPGSSMARGSPDSGEEPREEEREEGPRPNAPTVGGGPGSSLLWDLLLQPKSPEKPREPDVICLTDVADALPDSRTSQQPPRKTSQQLQLQQPHPAAAQARQPIVLARQPPPYNQVAAVHFPLSSDPAVNHKLLSYMQLGSIVPTAIRRVEIVKKRKKKGEKRLNDSRYYVPRSLSLEDETHHLSMPSQQQQKVPGERELEFPRDRTAIAWRAIGRAPGAPMPNPRPHEAPGAIPPQPPIAPPAPQAAPGLQQQHRMPQQPQQPQPTPEQRFATAPTERKRIDALRDIEKEVVLKKQLEDQHQQHLRMQQLLQPTGRRQLQVQQLQQPQQPPPNQPNQPRPDFRQSIREAQSLTGQRPSGSFPSIGTAPVVNGFAHPMPGQVQQHQRSPTGPFPSTGPAHAANGHPQPMPLQQLRRSPTGPYSNTGQAQAANGFAQPMPRQGQQRSPTGPFPQTGQAQAANGMQMQRTPPVQYLPIGTSQSNGAVQQQQPQQSQLGQQQQQHSFSAGFSEQQPQFWQYQQGAGQGFSGGLAQPLQAQPYPAETPTTTFPPVSTMFEKQPALQPPQGSMAYQQQFGMNGGQNQQQQNHFDYSIPRDQNQQPQQQQYPMNGQPLENLTPNFQNPQQQHYAGYPADSYPTSSASINQYPQERQDMHYYDQSFFTRHQPPACAYDVPTTQAQMGGAVQQHQSPLAPPAPQEAHGFISSEQIEKEILEMSREAKIARKALEQQPVQQVQPQGRFISSTDSSPAAEQPEQPEQPVEDPRSGETTRQNGTRVAHRIPNYDPRSGHYPPAPKMRRASAEGGVQMGPSAQKISAVSRSCSSVIDKFVAEAAQEGANRRKRPHSMDEPPTIFVHGQPPEEEREYIASHVQPSTSAGLHPTSPDSPTAFNFSDDEYNPEEMDRINALCGRYERSENESDDK